jgi:16S rRNA (guanine966-N2)-methyltransferase
MRVIAGSARGVRLGPVPPGVRPVSDRAREGLFSSLGAEVPEARVLDLYAGTGAMGIEALSRGAEHVTFVERDAQAAAAIHANLERTHLTDRATVHLMDVARFLARQAPERRFDLVLADPPYELDGDDLAPILAALAAGWLARDGWTVALTRGVKSSTPVIPVHWAVARQLRYGDSLVILFREVRWA